MITDTVITYTKQTCCVCGVHFAFDSDVVAKLKRTGDGFYCPNGHNLIFIGETETDKLKRELSSALNDRAYFRDRLDETAAELTTKKRLYTRTKNELTKVKTRIAAGVCPDCNRTFQNVARHMATKHSK
jgi:hypothetical protein